MPKLKEKIEDLLGPRDRLITQPPEAQIKTAVTFGPELRAQLYPQALADVLIHIASQRSNIYFTLSQSYFDGIQDQVEVLDEHFYFRYFDRRDLTGFIDGTENLLFPEDRSETALLGEEVGIFKDASFIFAQRYVHDLDKWKRLKADDQQSVIGRSKLESIEMNDDVKPQNAQIARVLIKDNEGEEMEILRHSLPYGDGKGEQGLFFIAYTKNLSIIDDMLEHMFGTTGDGIHDHLLNFVTTIDGAYFFAPSEELLEVILKD